jgi:hypothetical protein
LDVEAVKAVLEDLERCGDATAGPGGMVAAGPLRVVMLGIGRATMHGGIPSEWVRGKLSVESVIPGFPRSVVFTSEDLFKVAVVAAGGLVLTPERWAGLDRVPSSDADWLAELTDRLGSGASPAEPGSWTPYRTDTPGVTQGKRWGDQSDEGGNRLWRLRDDRGWWRFAWTGGESPSAGPFLTMTQDEACRAGFALDQEAGNPIPWRTDIADDRVRLEIDGYIPRAEYRFLTTLGERVPVDHRGGVFLIPTGSWGRVQGVLADRLGLAQ